MTSRLPVLLLLISGFAAPAAAGDAPSVLIRTEVPAQGQMPRIVTAYGATAPAPGASTTISVQYDGQVADLLVSPGQAVHDGDNLMRVVASANALSAYDQAGTALRLAQAQLAHARQLRGQQLATTDQVGQAEKAVSDAQTAVATMRLQGVDRTSPPLRSPFDGVVSVVAVSQGDRIAANVPLITLMHSGGIVLNAGVEPADRALVKPGDAVQMTALSDHGQVFSGMVDAVDARIDPKTRLVPVRIARTDGQMLLDNQDLRADIVAGQVAGWKLPRAAVLTDNKGAYVFQVAGGKAVRVDVHILVDAGATMLADGPLRAERALVTDGAYQLADGSDVRETAAK